MREIFDYGCAICGAFFLAVILPVIIIVIVLCGIFVILRDEKNLFFKNRKRS